MDVAAIQGGDAFQEWLKAGSHKSYERLGWFFNDFERAERSDTREKISRHGLV